MQTTSATYQTIIAGIHHFETKIVLDGHTLLESDGIRSCQQHRIGMEGSKPSVGAAIASTLSLKLNTPAFTIPKLAQIQVYVRAVSSTQTSEWLAQGTYFIDTCKHNDSVNSIGTVDITAFDAMAKADADYPNTTHSWPYLDQSVVAEIASAIGVTVDTRTNSFITSSYLIDLPLGYTMREVLENIAGSYGGNFVITAENKLLFVPIYGLDPIIVGNYLADENGNALVFGNEGWCILV